jgi:lysozyme family protein
MTIKPGRLGEFTAYAQYAIAYKDQYLAVEKATGVTWPHVAVLHRRESDAKFYTYLGNGDPLDRATVHVPRGRGPFKSFLDGAVDALRLDGLTSVQDWRLEKVLYYCELFNGAGYDMRGIPSPYLWGGTSIQVAGKYVADGVWSSSQWDTQPGCAAMLHQIALLDPTVAYVRET